MNRPEDESLEVQLERVAERLRQRMADSKYSEEDVRANISKALQHDDFLTKEAAEEAAFHMTDWILDLEDLVKLFDQSEWDDEAAQRLIMGFLAHVPNHVAAAHRIAYDEPIRDIFMLGAVKGSGLPGREPGGPYPELPTPQADEQEEPDDSERS